MTHTTSGEESSEGYCGDTPSPNPRPNDSWNGIENGSLIDRDATNFNSPGPSEGGTSVDSGFGKSKSPNPNQNVSSKTCPKFAENFNKANIIILSFELI